MMNMVLKAVSCAIFGIALMSAPVRAETGEPSLNAELVEIGRLIHQREQEVLDSEKRLDELKLRQRSILARFDRRRGELTQFLSALQRLGRQPQALLLVRSDAAIAHVRGAALLGVVIKNAEREAAELREDLEQISALEKVMTDERQQLVGQLADLQKGQAQLTGLLAEQAAQQPELIAAANAKAEELARLAKDARDNSELLDRLQEQSSPVEKNVSVTGRPREKPQITGRPGTDQESDQKELAMLPSPLEPSAPPASISAARGQLLPPARGRLSANFGDRDRSGATHRGLSIRTRENAEVLAPFSGKIVYAGPFRDYGQLLILEAGEGYHILLSGMSHVHTIVGQNVTQGQPIGQMGGGPAADGRRQEFGLRDLYVEFRKDGKPFDPLPWIEFSETKVKG